MVLLIDPPLLDRLQRLARASYVSEHDHESGREQDDDDYERGSGHERV